MPTVEIDREKAAAAALDWFRANAHAIFDYPDRDFLESEAGFSIAKALDSYDPETGVPLMAWLKQRVRWDVTSALRITDTGSRSKLRGKTHVRLSAFGDPANLLPFEEDKDSRLYVEDVLNYVKTRKKPREALIIEERFKGKTLKAIGEELGICESLVSKVNKKALADNQEDIRIFGESTCSKCKQTKPRSQFHIRRTALDGVESRCKSCRCLRIKKRAPWPLIRCTKCNRSLHFSNFAKEKKGYMGRRSRCTKCRSYADALYLARRES